MGGILVSHFISKEPRAEFRWNSSSSVPSNKRRLICELKMIMDITQTKSIANSRYVSTPLETEIDMIRFWNLDLCTDVRPRLVEHSDQNPNA